MLEGEFMRKSHQIVFVLALFMSACGTQGSEELRKTDLSSSVDSSMSFETNLTLRGEEEDSLNLREELQVSEMEMRDTENPFRRTGDEIVPCEGLDLSQRIEAKACFRELIKLGTFDELSGGPEEIVASAISTLEAFGAPAMVAEVVVANNLSWLITEVDGEAIEEQDIYVWRDDNGCLYVDMSSFSFRFCRYELCSLDVSHYGPDGVVNWTGSLSWDC